MAKSTASMDERYGRTRNRSVDRTIVFVTLGIVLIGTVIWALFGGWGGNAVAVKGDEIGFTIEDNNTLTLSYRVSGPPDTEIACALASMSQSKAVVGWKVVIHEPSEKPSRVFEESLVTVREPNSGYVHQCWVPESDNG